MPVFAQFFGALFTALGGFLLKLFVARVAIRIAAVTAILALSAGMFTAFNLALAPLISQVFNTQFGQFLGLLFPPISGTIITALLTAWMAVSAYRVKRHAIEVTAGI